MVLGATHKAAGRACGCGTGLPARRPSAARAAQCGWARRCTAAAAASAPQSRTPRPAGGTAGRARPRSGPSPAPLATPAPSPAAHIFMIFHTILGKRIFHLPMRPAPRQKSPEISSNSVLHSNYSVQHEALLGSTTPPSPLPPLKVTLLCNLAVQLV